MAQKNMQKQERGPWPASGALAVHEINDFQAINECKEN